MASSTFFRLIRALGAILVGVVIGFGLFMLSGWIGSSIPRNADWEEPATGIEIMVETNGTHTGIVMPVVTAEKDWRETFPSAGQPRPGDGRLPTHIAVGWGEREVFMETPTWGDLSPVTALRIAALGGDAVMRVSPYIRPAPSEHHRPLTITAAQYEKLAARIESSLPPPPPGGTRTILRGVEPSDAYYEAEGTYTLARTSNTWAGDVLGDAGVRMGWWTPFAGGVTKWVDAPA